MILQEQKAVLRGALQDQTMKVQAVCCYCV